MSTQDKFSVKMSIILKGVAILLMVIHHCFGFPEWYINGISYSSYELFRMPMSELVRVPTKICVAIFAFLSGWGYYYSKTKTLKYSLSKIFNLLKHYWTILFIIFIPIIIYFNGNVISSRELILNALTLKSGVIVFSWYVSFYIITMLSIPFIIKGIKGKWLLDLLYVPLICVLLYHILEKIIAINPNVLILPNLRDYLYFFPSVYIGYYMAYYKIFDKFDKNLKPSNSQAMVIIVLILYYRLKMNSFFEINLDIIYSPILIYMAVNILYSATFLHKILLILGNNSLNIWLLHSIFFNEYTNQVFQKIGFAPRFPLLVIVWVILLCLFVSFAINKLFLITRVICSGIKRYF